MSREGGAQSDTVARMRLRPDPPRVTRLSRKFLAGVGLVAGLGLGAALIYSLQTRQAADGGNELYPTDNRTPADGLSRLPRDYTGPLLGPPLPGDLGRPILSTGTRPPAIAAPDPGLSEEERRELQEIESARVSKLFLEVEASERVGQGITGGGAATGLGQSDLASLGLAPQPASPNAEERKVAFLEAAPDKRTVAPDRVEAPASPYVLQAGSIIPAALVTGIRSDLPGQITAQVTEAVRDSPTGRIILIPQGARLIGEYDNSVQFGQRRVLLVWNRLILPNGRSIVLERQPGADQQGYAGLEDGVDHHWWDLAKAAGLSTLLGIGSELVIDEEERLLRAVRDGLQDTIEDAGQQIIRRQLAVPPTLTVRPGFPVRVIVTRDLVLEPYESSP